jgi:DNA-binding transcriptional MerR regulator
LIKQLQERKFTLQEIRQILDPNRGENGPSAVEATERLASDLDKLRTLVQETRSAALATDQPALRLVAAEALHRATALCTLLVTLLQDIPLL